MSIVIALAKKPVNSIEDLINILKNYKNNEYNVVLKYNFPNKNFVDVLKDKYDQIPDIINYINGYIKQLSSIINDITIFICFFNLWDYLFNSSSNIR
jgi:hypothetical protein